MTIERSLKLTTLVLALGALRCGSGVDADPGIVSAGLGGYGAGGGNGSVSPGAGGTSYVPPPAFGSGAPAGLAGSSSAAGGAGTAGSAGASGTGGVASAGGRSGDYTVDPIGNKNRNPGFVDLSPPMGAPLDDVGTTLNPPPPDGWKWYAIDGAVCRDGSPTGFFLHRGTEDKLVLFLEGGGACSNNHFCAFNPSSASQALSGDGATVIGSTFGAVPGRQQPGIYSAGKPDGLFDFANPANPFKDWSQVYVPYCTGDVHGGTKKDGTVPGLAGAQQFVGGLNMRLFMGRIVPTFKDKLSRVVITGPSAGGFGAAINYSMVQDAFGDVLVTALDDSGPPFRDEFMPPCMQKRWRDAWHITFPPDCTECTKPDQEGAANDGGGMLHLADFLIRKHPHATIGVISSMEDEVIRLFYSVSMNDCSGYDASDPVAITLGQFGPDVYFPAAQYTGGLNAIRSDYQSTNRLATYFMPGQLHQHIFRAEFYTATAGGQTQAAWVQDFLNGKLTQVGP